LRAALGLAASAIANPAANILERPKVIFCVISPALRNRYIESNRQMPFPSRTK
jgi:hypothetical protein